MRYICSDGKNKLRKFYFGIWKVASFGMRQAIFYRDQKRNVLCCTKNISLRHALKRRVGFDRKDRGEYGVGGE